MSEEQITKTDIHSVDIKTEEINRFFRGKWKNKGCEICLEMNWSIGPPEGRYIFLPTGDGTHPSTMTTRLVPTLLILCVSCGNTKLLSTFTIKRWLSDNPNDPIDGGKE